MPALRAQNGEGIECSNAMLKGLYGFGADAGLELGGDPGIEALGGFPASFIGLFYADGEGRITMFNPHFQFDSDLPTFQRP